MQKQRQAFAQATEDYKTFRKESREFFQDHFNTKIFAVREAYASLSEPSEEETRMYDQIQEDAARMTPEKFNFFACLFAILHNQSRKIQFLRTWLTSVLAEYPSGASVCGGAIYFTSTDYTELELEFQIDETQINRILTN